MTEARSSRARMFGAQPLGRQLEGGPRAGAGLEEQVHDGLAAEGRDLLDLAPRDLLEGLGSLQDEVDLLHRQVLDAEQVFALEAHGFTAGAPRGPGSPPPLDKLQPILQVLSVSSCPHRWL